MSRTEAETGRVVVVGSANADLVLQVHHRPAPGETVLAGTSTTTPGGKGANQAVAAARMGGRATFVGCVGRDGHARLLQSSMHEAGVDLAGVAVVDAPTGHAVIVITPDGENSIIVTPGANSSLDADAVDRSAARWTGDDVVVAQLEIPMETVTRAARRAAQVGARFVLNAAPAAAVAPEVLALCDPLVVNEDEAGVIVAHAGVDLGANLEGIKATAAALTALGARSAVVTLGPEGALVASAAGVEHIPAPRVRAVDTTGAGDGFVGALAARLSRGDSLSDAARVAAAFASAAVTRLGAQSAYVEESALEAVLSERTAATSGP
ncbi:ribokinase [Blastococcus colisei]|uniref:Ribokinase n=1 Tax=Blastococcus colisei TaxID=1564162 RepID=A0A543PJF5_9ACTN|nr:ribokinase [Blastococcus colisei]TQN44189.1 ribokinase [Blastococcus colisei]